MELEHKFSEYRFNTKKTHEYCERHKRYKIYLKRFDFVTCPNCYQEDNLEKENAKRVDELVRREEEYKRQVILGRSIMNDKLKQATFENFKVEDDADAEVLEKVKALGRRYLKGSKANAVFVGGVGTGKSHLAYALIKKMTEHDNAACTFVNVVDMFSKAKEDFSKESRFVEELAKVDFLVLDDLGLENQSKWSNNIIYSILDKRERTIITTNFSADELAEKYNPQITDRITKGLIEENIIDFSKVKSKRRTATW